MNEGVIAIPVQMMEKEIRNQDTEPHIEIFASAQHICWGLKVVSWNSRGVQLGHAGGKKGNVSDSFLPWEKGRWWRVGGGSHKQFLLLIGKLCRL